jgi:hypothetical protein
MAATVRRRVPARNTQLMEAAQRRLTAKLGSFFAERAQDVSRQIYERMARETIGNAQVPLPGSLDPARSAVFEKIYDDLHVNPANAIAINLVQPVADVVTRANIQHISWEMVREGQTGTERTTVPLAAIIPTQQVVDKMRVVKHEEELRRGEDPTNPPLALLWQGDYFLLGGHHGISAAHNLGITEVVVDVMTAPG